MCAVCARNSGSKWASMTDSSSACGLVWSRRHMDMEELLESDMWNVESVRKVLWLLFTLWFQSLLLVWRSVPA